MVIASVIALVLGQAAAPQEKEKAPAAEPGYSAYPMPAFASDKNSGLTWGVLGALMFTNDEGIQDRLITAMVAHQHLAGWSGEVDYRYYPSLSGVMEVDAYQAAMAVSIPTQPPSLMIPSVVEAFPKPRIRKVTVSKPAVVEIVASRLPPVGRGGVVRHVCPGHRDGRHRGHILADAHAHSDPYTHRGTFDQRLRSHQPTGSSDQQRPARRAAADPGQ